MVTKETKSPDAKSAYLVSHDDLYVTGKLHNILQFANVNAIEHCFEPAIMWFCT